MLSWTLPSCPQDVFVVDMQTGSTTSLTAGECHGARVGAGCTCSSDPPCPPQMHPKGAGLSSPLTGISWWHSFPPQAAPQRWYGDIPVPSAPVPLWVLVLTLLPMQQVAVLPGIGQEAQIKWICLQNTPPVPGINWGIRTLKPPPEQENPQYGECWGWHSCYSSPLSPDCLCHPHRGPGL